MSEARRDQNRVTTLIGVSSIDGITPTIIKVNPVTGAILIDGDSLYTSLDQRYALIGQGGGISGSLTDEVGGVWSLGIDTTGHLITTPTGIIYLIDEIGNSLIDENGNYLIA